MHIYIYIYMMKDDRVELAHLLILHGYNDDHHQHHHHHHGHHQHQKHIW